MIRLQFQVGARSGKALRHDQAVYPSHAVFTKRSSPKRQPSPSEALRPGARSTVSPSHGLRRDDLTPPCLSPNSAARQSIERRLPPPRKEETKMAAHSGKGTKNYKARTRVVVAGRDPAAQHGFVNMPAFRGSTVLYPTMDDLDAPARPLLLWHARHARPPRRSRAPGAISRAPPAPCSSPRALRPARSR